MSPFNSKKVEAYALGLRKVSHARLSDFCSRHGLNAELYSPLSLPLASWIYYQLRSGTALSPSDLDTLVKRDILRQQFMVGYDTIFLSDVSNLTEGDKKYEQALKLVREVWPEMADLIEVTVKRVSHPLPEYTFESSSDPKIFGQVYFNMRRNSVMDWARVLVHEISHQYVFVLTAEWQKQGLKFPWEETVFSEIKKINRPLIGLFHGAVAQANMLELAFRVLENKSANPEDRRGASWTIGLYGDGYPRDLLTASRFGLNRVTPEIELIFEGPRQRLFHQRGSDAVA